MKKAMSLMLALGMFATLLAPCAAAEQATAVDSQTAEAAMVAELAEEAAPETPAEVVTEAEPTEEETVTEEAPAAEPAASEEANEEPDGEVSAEVSAAPGDVAIDATNFPDDNFRQFVLDAHYDSDNDGVLSAAEISGVTDMDVSNKDIANLKGIKLFTALKILNCNGNKILQLDVSGCTALTKLDCYSNGMTSLNVNGCTNLQEISCSTNQLSTLDTSSCSVLSTLQCSTNKLISLDVSKNSALRLFNCSNNQLTSLKAKGTALDTMNCDSNKLTSLDVSGTSVRRLNCGFNRTMTELDISNCIGLDYVYAVCNSLTSIKLNGCKALTHLELQENKFTSLDVSGCTALYDLRCDMNSLTSLNVSGCTELAGLDCYKNKLTTLDLSKNTKLVNLNVGENNLEALDISKNTVLTKLYCHDNALATLDVSNNPQLDSSKVFGNNQTVIFVPKQVKDSWQYDLKELVGATNLSRITSVKSDYGTYNTSTGIITFTAAPTEATSFSYEYSTKDTNGYKMPVTAKPQAKAPSAGTAAFTDRLYSVCLGRLPDAAGKADWVNQLTSYQISGTKAAYGFVFSKEFQDKKYSNADFVEHLYEAFMGRASDAGGKAYWIKQLESGKSREEVFYGFADSVEFDKICNDYGIVAKDIETFVTRFYKVCLERMPDAGGLADWSNQLRGKTRTGRDVAYGFIFSKEFTGKNYSNEDYVEHLYAAFMGRASDAAGKADWVKQLQSGKSREDVFNGFVGSKEFSDICASYDIVRG